MDRGRDYGGGGSRRAHSPEYGSSQKSSSKKGGLCEVCGKRPRFVEWNGLVHPYCGRTCARASQPLCKYPPCNYPGKSTFSGYCGPGHARDAVQDGHATPCVECKKQPQAIDELCLGCNSSLGRSTEPRLKELSLQDPQAASLIDNFNHMWKGPEPVEIGKVYEIRLPPNMVKSRDAYHNKLIAVKKPRQIQTFHSTQCICDLGTNSTEFCDWSGCGICAILLTAFTEFEFDARSNTGRFGPGIYSYLNPSLADKWAVSTTSSPYKVMLACEVNLLPPRQKAPFFSGLCSSREEGPLVYVSGAEAITPKYLILYSKPKSSTSLSKGSPTGSSGRNSILHE
ncbi:hypothetical protein BJ322DRAFT_1169402 [Thelephora terrestris]|uniref:PARP catalytic domain-containing protein n=1 Tax=Thelephora terrestris TaxID=56493 RepID=A0A9P6HML0_9AGAM|nr:hypothetical protein BJ322DRAFT_1169402 [Thelephora terrestris]